ncbi:MAG: cytochrome c oxidase subunit 2A [Anaerolineae bacterium]|nr:MAG: cytochrome c oxidase subunit 2A [Anaerolineae bacterium]
MSDKNQEFHPKGTLTILIIFVLTLILLWGSVYLILLNRGVTI